MDRKFGEAMTSGLVATPRPGVAISDWRKAKPCPFRWTSPYKGTSDEALASSLLASPLMRTGIPRGKFEGADQPRGEKNCRGDCRQENGAPAREVTAGAMPRRPRTSDSALVFVTMFGHHGRPHSSARHPIVKKNPGFL